MKIKSKIWLEESGQLVFGSGQVILDIIKRAGGGLIKYDIVADEMDLIRDKLILYSDNLKVDIVFTAGGTGLGPRDETPEATKEISQKLIPGMSELIRWEGLKKTKRSVLSRGISAIRNQSIIINLPGSPKGAGESLGFIIDLIPHMLAMVRGEGHDSKKQNNLLRGV